jgi:hypothetical protein
MDALALGPHRTCLESLMVPAEDGLGSDFSGIRAHAALELHMRECAERRAEDRADRSTTNARLTAMQESFDKRMSELTATLDRRMTGMSNRMWALVISGGGAAFVGLAALIFHLLTRAR